MEESCLYKYLENLSRVSTLYYSKLIFYNISTAIHILYSSLVITTATCLIPTVELLFNTELDWSLSTFIYYYIQTC